MEIRGREKVDTMEDTNLKLQSYTFTLRLDNRGECNALILTRVEI